MQGWPSLGENIVYLIWKNSIEQIASQSIYPWKTSFGLPFAKCWQKLSNLKIWVNNWLSLLKEYYVVLQVTYRTHDPPPPPPHPPPIWKYVSSGILQIQQLIAKNFRILLLITQISEWYFLKNFASEILFPVATNRSVFFQTTPKMRFCYISGFSPRSGLAKE